MNILRWCTGLLLSLLTCCALAQNTPHVTVEMRDHGYTMGDIIHQKVSITLARGQTLDENSLPLQGRVTPWLDLREVAISRHDHSMDIHLVWQIFATVEVAQKLKTPELVLKTVSKPALEITIPKQDFYYSPVFSNPLGDTARRADLPPVVNTGKTHFILMLSLGVMSLLLGLFWLWLKDLIPWLPFHPGPLTRLSRTLKANSNPEIQQQHLKDILHALNVVAGASLYPSNWEVLFERAPYLLALKVPITHFFFTSWKMIYSHAPLSNNMRNKNESDEELSNIDWVHQAALLERLNKRRYVQLAKRRRNPITSS